jgi:hypothetical protein
MERHADTFIFRLTSVCDKKCMLCCNNYDGIKKRRTVPFGALLGRFADIRDYWAEGRHEDRQYIFFTGGEAFLYRSAGREGTATLCDVIGAAHGLIPRAGIVVKTGGFGKKGKYQRDMFDRISAANPFPIVEFRLGFNRYQDSEEAALDRFVCTVETVLAHQRMIAIDTIYDRTNLPDTCGALEEGLRRIGIGAERNMLLDLVLENPNEHRRIEIRTTERSIILDLGPSYPSSVAAASHEYYSEPSSACDLIETGTSSLYYDTDMGLIHCNDPFVDARVPSMGRRHGSIRNEVTFVNGKLGGLSRFLKREGVRFASRQERCFFCTKYVMTDLGAGDGVTTR